MLNRVLQSAPGHLPARFGLLHLLQDRVDEDPALQPSFERDLDLFLADAPRNATIAPVETPKHSSILRVLRLFLSLPGGNRSEVCDRSSARTRMAAFSRFPPA